jgi:hypothetical protein
MEYSFEGQRVQVEGEPTDAERRVIESYVRFRAHLGFSAKIGLFRKRETDNWCYGMGSWTSGPEMIPEPHEDPRSLVSLLDWINVIRGGEWDEWKAAHPGIFARALDE